MWRFSLLFALLSTVAANHTRFYSSYCYNITLPPTTSQEPLACVRYGNAKAVMARVFTVGTSTREGSGSVSSVKKIECCMIDSGSMPLGWTGNANVAASWKFGQLLICAPGNFVHGINLKSVSTDTLDWWKEISCIKPINLDSQYASTIDVPWRSRFLTETAVSVVGCPVGAFIIGFQMASRTADGEIEADLVDIEFLKCAFPLPSVCFVSDAQLSKALVATPDKACGKVGDIEMHQYCNLTLKCEPGYFETLEDSPTQAVLWNPPLNRYTLSSTYINDQISKDPRLVSYPKVQPSEQDFNDPSYSQQWAWHAGALAKLIIDLGVPRSITGIVILGGCGDPLQRFPTCNTSWVTKYSLKFMNNLTGFSDSQVMAGAENWFTPSVHNLTKPVLARYVQFDMFESRGIVEFYLRADVFVKPTKFFMIKDASVALECDASNQGSHLELLSTACQGKKYKCEFALNASGVSGLRPCINNSFVVVEWFYNGVPQYFTTKLATLQRTLITLEPSVPAQLTCQPSTDKMGVWAGQRVQCVDMDECRAPCNGTQKPGTHECHTCNQSVSNCSNLEGSFTCICKPGYAFNTTTNACVNVNECAAAACNTGENPLINKCYDCKTTSTKCQDQTPGFVCQCLDGFVPINGSNTTCAPVNECNVTCKNLSSTYCNRCIKPDSCVDTLTGYTCSCPTGYEGDGRTCTDIDECKTDGLCPKTFICNNLPGNYSCDCPSGYAQRNSICEDVDECQTIGCKGGPCQNTEGSYFCPPYISNVRWQPAKTTDWIDGSIILTSMSQVIADKVEITIGNFMTQVGYSYYLQPASFSYGSVESLDDFTTSTCVTVYQNVFQCDLIAGAGKKLFFSFVYCVAAFQAGNIRNNTNQDICTKVTTTNFSFAYPAPILFSGTLRRNETGSGATNLTLPSQVGTTVFMDGANLFSFMSDKSKLQTRINFFSAGSPTRYECLLLNTTETSISCAMSIFSGTNLTFSVSVGRDSSAQVADGTDVILVETKTTNAPCNGFPSIMSISGCSTSAPSSSIMGCPTQGGVTINVTSSIALMEPIVVLVAGKQCPVTTISPSNTSIACTLPGGVGRNVPIMIGHATPIVFSLPFSSISYGAPTISSIYSSSCSVADGVTLVNCSDGGTLSINGANFGDSGATVFAGGELFNAVHESQYGAIAAHQNLRIPFPSFKPGVLQVSVFASSGAFSRENVFYSFAPCGNGRFTNTDGSCTACPRGYYTNSSAQKWCVPCELGFYQNAIGQSECKRCDRGSFAPVASTTCLPCPEGTFSQDQAGACTLCVPGKWSPGMSAECTSCEVGTSQSQAGMAMCENCKPGFFANQSASTICSQCLPGKSAVNPARSSCENCQPGRFQPNSGASQCLACPPGVFSDVGALQCLPCAPGSVSNESSTTKCTLCSPGWFQDRCGMQSCQQCPAGTSSALSGQVRCAPCQPGRATNLTQQLDCQDCQVGRHQSNAGSTSCDQCDPGQFSGVAALLCQKCKKGKEASGQTGCQACTAGKFRASEDDEQGCVKCSSGWYQSAVDQALCKECPAGWYSNSSTTCEQCPPGSYSTSMSTSCVACAPGFYTKPFDGQTECLTCAAGRFSNQTAATACAQCGLGFISARTAATICSKCEDEGTFSSALFTSCDKCASGQYSAGKSLEECNSCPPGATLSSEQSVCQCPAGQYAVTTTELNATTQQERIIYQCFDNPTGTSKEEAGVVKSELVTLPGYWRSNNQSLTYYRCYAPQFCLGGKMSTCGKFREGPVCALCKSGYKSAGTNRECALCPVIVETSWGITVAILLAVGVALVFAYWLILKMSDTQQQELIAKERARLDASVSNMTERATVGDAYFAQLRAEIDSERQSKLFPQKLENNVAKPEEPEVQEEESEEPEEEVTKKVEDEEVTYGERRAPNFMYKIKIMVGFYQVASLLPNQGGIIWPQQFVDFINFFSFLNFDFVPWQNLACAVSMNYYTKILIVGFLPIGMILALAIFFSVSLFFYGRKDNLATQMAKQNRILRTKRQFTKLVLFTIFLLYPFVSKTTLGVYNCVEIEGVHYLAADFTLLCGSPDWNIAAGFSAVFVAMYPIGTPIIYYVLMSRVDRRSPDAFLELGFLYEAYVDDRWYWELLDMGHKLILTSIVVFMPNELIMGANMVIMVLYLILLLVCNPYLRKGDDRLHLLAQTNLFVLALMGHALRLLDDPFKAPFASRSTVEALLSALLIAINVLFLTSFLIIAGRNIKKVYDHYRAKKLDPFARRPDESSHALRSFNQQLALVTMG